MNTRFEGVRESSATMAADATSGSARASLSPGTEVDFVVDYGQAVSVYCHRSAETAFPSAEQPGHRVPASPSPIKANGMAIAGIAVGLIDFFIDLVLTALYPTIFAALASAILS